ncbi:hypothetical protein CONPUDRAFT_78343 [Coniophora puteana RWD-64-598 SS2]|uniref:Uncharacterized protein n=1 Tax=Coniophora puteana (strain RWD-64-598) TaxID=741705 RepID=R7SG69_CONPW|nr:uncharacterized protein CONPUDRAFT_78343 [Coniophora puteana RWD-64-598 SS2]EIW74084.1 hypothetical protein CONPUDRAFT_78343 [Coniophora puteana RWD-64-598 SS2]
MKPLQTTLTATAQRTSSTSPDPQSITVERRYFRFGFKASTALQRSPLAHRLESLPTSEDSVKHHVAYDIYTGPGAPPPPLGGPDDLYVNLSDALLHAKLVGGWTKWPGVTQPAKGFQELQNVLLSHPDFSGLDIPHTMRYLWCNPRRDMLGWFDESFIANNLTFLGKIWAMASASQRLHRRWQIKAWIENRAASARLQDALSDMDISNGNSNSSETDKDTTAGERHAGTNDDATRKHNAEIAHTPSTSRAPCNPYTQAPTPPQEPQPEPRITVETHYIFFGRRASAALCSSPPLADKIESTSAEHSCIVSYDLYTCLHSGAPDPALGCLGDVYINRSDNLMYAKLVDGWTKWTGITQPKKVLQAQQTVLIPHPELGVLPGGCFLWCNVHRDVLGWVEESFVARARKYLQKRYHKVSAYQRLNGQWMGQSGIAESDGRDGGDGGDGDNDGGDDDCNTADEDSKDAGKTTRTKAESSACQKKQYKKCIKKLELDLKQVLPSSWLIRCYDGTAQELACRQDNTIRVQEQELQSVRQLCADLTGAQHSATDLGGSSSLLSFHRRLSALQC